MRKNPKPRKKNFREFKRTIRKNKKQYYNICKDIEDGNTHGNIRKAFQKLSDL